MLEYKNVDPVACARNDYRNHYNCSNKKSVCCTCVESKSKWIRNLYLLLLHILPDMKANTQFTGAADAENEKVLAAAIEGDSSKMSNKWCSIFMITLANLFYLWPRCNIFFKCISPFNSQLHEYKAFSNPVWDLIQSVRETFVWCFEGELKWTQYQSERKRENDRVHERRKETLLCLSNIWFIVLLLKQNYKKLSLQQRSSLSLLALN